MANFATSTENQRAANELYSGPKSRMVPVHDSMGGYDGHQPAALEGSTPTLRDNIMAAAKRQGYPNVPISEGNYPTALNEI